MIFDSDASFHIEGAIFALRPIGGATAIDMCHTQRPLNPGYAGRKWVKNHGGKTVGIEEPEGTSTHLSGKLLSLMRLPRPGNDMDFF